MGQAQATGTATLTLPPTPYHQTSHIHLPTIFPNQYTLPSSKSPVLPALTELEVRSRCRMLPLDASVSPPCLGPLVP